MERAPIPAVVSIARRVGIALAGGDIGVWGVERLRPCSGGERP